MAVTSNKQDFLERFLQIPENNKVLARLIIFLRIILVSINRFMKDDCMIRASGIAFTFIITLVPTLAVGLAFLTLTSGFEQKKKDLFDSINTFLQNNNVLIDINPYLETLNTIVNAATQIGAIGFVVFIFSATGVLRTLEHSFNQIWKVTSERSYFYKMIYYFFIMTIGPLLLMVGSGIIINLTQNLRASHLHSITRSSDNFLWLSGERGTIIKIDETGDTKAKLKNLKVDFENMTCLDKTGQVLKVCNTPVLQKENFIKIRNKHDHMYALSKNGVLLFSNDFGNKWSVFNFNAEFKDFATQDDDNLILIFEEGKLLKYNIHTGEVREPILIGSSKMEVNKVRFVNPEIGYMVDDLGNLWKTTNGGDTFVKKEHLINGGINDIVFVGTDRIALVGDKGAIRFSKDSGETWKILDHRNIKYTEIWSIPNIDNVGTEEKIEIIIKNDAGKILYSNDLGENWKVTDHLPGGVLDAMIPINPKFGFKALNPEEDEVVESGDIPKESEMGKHSEGDILAVGEFNKIVIGNFENENIVWNAVNKGDNIFSPYSLLSKFATLVLIWIFFFSLYMLIPGTKVSLKAALIGSAITGIMLLIFGYAFGIYITSFATTTMVIYRGLAAIPLFLLSIYGLSLIVLLGAEITATIQYKERYMALANPFAQEQIQYHHNLYRAIEYLATTYRYQKKYRKFITKPLLKRVMRINDTEFGLIQDILLIKGFIAFTKNDEIVPCWSVEDLSVYNLYETITMESLKIPPNEEKEKLAIALKEKMLKVEQVTKETLLSVKFNELISI